VTARAVPNQKTPPSRREFDFADPEFRHRASAAYPRKVVDDIAERHGIDGHNKKRLRERLIGSGRFYLVFQEHAASDPDKQAVNRLRGKLRTLLSDIDSADENTRYKLEGVEMPETLKAAHDRLSALSASRGRPVNHALYWWVVDMAAFWVNVLDRKFTIDYHRGDGVTAAYSFLKDALDPLDPDTNELLTAARKVRTIRRRLADKN